jgi:hypothetical protein
MAVRNQHTRTSTNNVMFTFNKVIVTLLSDDNSIYKSKLYSIKNKILSGKITIPDISTKTGISPFLLGYCSNDEVRFVWN